MANILLKELYKLTIDSVKDSRESTKFIFDKSDDIIKWIVGFFVAIITLLVSKVEIKNIILLTKNDLEFIILIYSLIILIFGLLFRLFSFLTQLTLNNITESFLGFSRGYIIDTDNIPQPREITNDETIKDLIYYLEVDFGYKNAEIPIANYSEEYRKLLTKFYKELSKNNDIELQLETFNENFSKYFGISMKKIKNLNNDQYILKRAIFYKIFTYSSIISFILTLLFIIILAIKLIFRIV